VDDRRISARALSPHRPGARRLAADRCNRHEYNIALQIVRLSALNLLVLRD
jgi:hypothetical protein